MTLLAVAHGTRDPAGVATIRALLDRVRVLRPGLAVAESYAEISEPSLDDVVTGLAGLPARGPVVAVPLMLGRGYHALVDIPGRIGGRATVARPLGPHALLATALADRLRQVRPADAVVLGAAGTSDPSGVAGVRAAALFVARRLGRPVSYGFAASAGPALPDVVTGLRLRGARRVAIGAYLLAPGYFHRRLLAAGADEVSPPLGAHDAVARLILRRYDEAATRRPADDLPQNAIGRA
jgi:sirohydrochlorin ferrochelatase